MVNSCVARGTAPINTRTKCRKKSMVPPCFSGGPVTLDKLGLLPLSEKGAEFRGPFGGTLGSWTLKVSARQSG